MRRLVVSTDSNLVIKVAWVTCEEAEKKLRERLEWEGKSVLVWHEKEIPTVFLEDIPRNRIDRPRETRPLTY